MLHYNNLYYNRLGNNIQEYRGMFFNENKNKTYFEGGAHFSYNELVQKLKGLTKILSNDRMSKKDTHQKTKSFTIEKTILQAMNKNYQKRQFDSLDQKKVNKKSKKIMLKTISHDKELDLGLYTHIHTEINKQQKSNQFKSKVKLNSNFNTKTKKQFPIIKQTKEQFTSRNICKCILPKDNTFTNPFLSIDAFEGQQLTERKQTKHFYKSHILKYQKSCK